MGAQSTVGVKRVNELLIKSDVFQFMEVLNYLASEHFSVLSLHNL